MMGQSQKLILIDRQKLDMKQSVVNSLGMFLAIAEGYLIKKGIKFNRHFGYYDHFNVTQDNPDLIRLKLLNNYQVFCAQKQNYLTYYKQYDFYPDNLPVEKLIQILKEYVKYAEHIQEGQLYQNILFIFTEEQKIPIHTSRYPSIRGFERCKAVGL